MFDQVKPRPEKLVVGACFSKVPVAVFFQMGFFNRLVVTLSPNVFSLFYQIKKASKLNKNESKLRSIKVFRPVMLLEVLRNEPLTCASQTPKNISGSKNYFTCSIFNI